MQPPNEATATLTRAEEREQIIFATCEDGGQTLQILANIMDQLIFSNLGSHRRPFSTCILFSVATMYFIPNYLPMFVSSPKMASFFPACPVNSTPWSTGPQFFNENNDNLRCCLQARTQSLTRACRLHHVG